MQGAIVFMAVVSVLLIFLTFVAPNQNFALKKNFEKMLSLPTWTDERHISLNATLTSPPMNWKSVVSNSSFYTWFEVRAPAH